MVLSACGRFANKNKDNSTSGSGDTLNGTWQDHVCQEFKRPHKEADGTYSSTAEDSFWGRASETFTNGRYSSESATYMDKDCNVLEQTIKLVGSYKIGTVVDGAQDIKQLDINIETGTKTAYSDVEVAKYNGRKECGVMWQKGVAQTISDTCLKIYLGPIYQIFQIKDSKRYYGKTSDGQYGTAPDNRPTQIDPSTGSLKVN